MAGQNADMTLKVGLDLNFFRQELQKASSALAGQPIDINVRFNRSKITNELRLLSNSLSRKKYDVEVKSTSLKILLDKVEQFKKSLAELKKEDISLNVKVESSISGAKAAEARRDIISKITGPKGAIFVPIEVKPPLVKNINAIRKSIKDSLSGIVIEVEAKVKGGATPASAAGMSAGGVSQTKRPSFLDSPAYQAELNKIAKANAQALAKAAASLPSGRNRQEVERLLQAFQAQNPQGASRTSALGAIRDLIARGRYQQGLGFEASLQPLRGQRQASAARSMPNLNEMLDRMANLTSNPRAAQRMLRALPESRITTDLVGAANRQAAFQQQFPQGFTLPGFNAPKAFDPLLKAIAKDFSDYARTVNISDPWVGQVSNGIANVIAKAAASPQVTRLLPAAGQTSASRMTQQMFAGLPALQAPGIGMENAPLSRAGQYMLNKARRALELPIGPASPYAPNPFAGQATVPSRQYFQPTMRPALPAAGGTSGLLSALEAQLGASRGMLGTGGGIATSLFTGRGLVNPGVSMLEPVGLSGNYRQMAAALANQAANPALAHRQIADIGFGGVPTSATGLSGQALNAALNQAFLQRRGLGISGAQSLPIFGTGGVAVQQNIPGMAYQMGGGPPSVPPVPPGGGGGGGGLGGAAGFGGFGRAMSGITLPGSGTIRELGEEFGFATKQVLLFGQAYKLLGFLQSFPGQVATAVGQLQSFRNSLGEVTTSTQEFATSNRYILSLVDQYNIPLQSARDGFTKLYASMQPAGFAGNEIRGIFEGISMGAATFGMSADKVDRVMYAFAQMASKGQVMSEELKGQLGDVLPGALSLFAKAANMSVQDFGQAMEDGAFKGEAMKQLLINVGATMKEEFGKGAVGAASTFQGVMNRLQTTVQLFYEAFEPAAVLFSNAFILPITNGIRTVTDGFHQLMTGQAAITQGGAELASSLQSLIPSLQGIWQNLQMAAGAFMNIAGAVASVVKVYMQFLSLPIVGVLAQTYTTVLLLNGAFTLLGGKVLMGLIASLVTTVGRMTALQMATIATNTALAGTQLQLRLLASGLAATSGAAIGFATAFRTALLTTGVGAVAVFVGYAISEFMRLRGVMDDIMGRYKNIGDQARLMGESGNVSGIQKLTQNLKEQANTYEDIAKGIEEGQKRIGLRVLGKTAVDAMKRAGLGGYLSGSTIKEEDIASVMDAINKNRQETKSTMTILAGQRSKAEKAAAELDAKLKKDTITLQQGKDGDKAAQKAKNDAEQLAKQQQQRAIELANFQNDMQKIAFDRDVQLSDAAFEHKKNLIDALNAYELSGLNDMQARQVKFAQDLKAIQLDAIDAVRKAMQQTQAAQLNVTAARATASAASVPMTGETIDKSVLRNWLISQGFGRTTGDFTNRGHATPNHMLNAMDMGILGGSDAEALRKTSEMEKKLRATGAFGGQLFGPISDPYGHGAGKGGQNIHLHIPTPGGKVKMTPGLASLMGKQSSPAFSMQTKEQKEGFDLAKEQAKAASTEELAQLEIQNKLKEAYAKTAAVIKSNIDSIFPVEKQKLDVRLQQMRNNLLMQGMPQEYIDYEEKRTATMEEGAMALDVMKTNLGAAEAELKVYQDAVAKGTALTVEQNANVTRLTGAITAYKDGIASATTKQQEYNIALLEGSIAAMKNADAMKAMQETADRINQAVEGTTGTFKGMFKEIAKGGDYSEIERVQQELDKAREEGDKKAVKRLEEQLKNMSPFTPVLKKVQEELADQALTMFFDFAMQPVEKFFKDQLGAIFGLPNEEAKRKEQLSAMEKQLQELQVARETQQKIQADTAAIRNGTGGQGGVVQSATNTLPGASAIVQGIDIPIDQMPAGMQFEESINAASENLNTATQGVAETVNKTAEKTAEANVNWQKALGTTVQGIGIAAGSIMGIAAGINQIKEGGTSNILGGIGMIASMAGSLLGGIGSLGGLFGGGGGPSAIVQGVDIPASALPPGMAFANGGIAVGGFRAFADGGMVSGPTLGLVGEGRYNEAVVPLPNGRAIPVQINGSRSARDLMGSNAPGMANAAPLTLKFESTKINGVEYVSREQLELAMAETRRASIAGGATRGMNMALDKIQQSPSTRSRIGIR